MIMHRSSKQWSRRYIQKLKILFFLPFFVLFNIITEVTNAPLVFFVLSGQYNRHFLCEWNDCSILFKLNRSIYEMNSMCVFVIGCIDGWMPWCQVTTRKHLHHSSKWFIFLYVVLIVVCFRMQQLIFQLCWWQKNWKYQTIAWHAHFE